MKSHEILREATGKVGVKAVAVDMNLSTSLVYKWCQSKDGRNASGAENPLDRVLTICELTEDEGPIAWLCQQVDGFFVKNPSADEGGRQPLLKVTQEILKEFSDLLDVMSRSIENDGEVDAREAANIRKEWEELKAVTESFVVACESGAYRPSRY